VSVDRCSSQEACCSHNPVGRLLSTRWYLTSKLHVNKKFHNNLRFHEALSPSKEKDLNSTIPQGPTKYCTHSVTEKACSLHFTQTMDDRMGYCRILRRTAM